jgi:hypothetical protein
MKINLSYNGGIVKIMLEDYNNFGGDWHKEKV